MADDVVPVEVLAVRVWPFAVRLDASALRQAFELPVMPMLVREVVLARLMPAFAVTDSQRQTVTFEKPLLLVAPR
jgi:hypothetical protein